LVGVEPCLDVALYDLDAAASIERHKCLSGQSRLACALQRHEIQAFRLGRIEGVSVKAGGLVLTCEDALHDL
jgi:hypothetical protein